MRYVFFFAKDLIAGKVMLATGAGSEEIMKELAARQLGR